MIEMQVMGIALDTRTGSPIVVLHDKDNRRALPIWIGSAEASAIIRKIENIPATRPMTHDLIVNMIKDLKCEISRIEIYDVSDDTYFANIVIINPDKKEIAIDSRPSDAIAVAIRVDMPIYISSKVLASGAVSCDSAKDEEEAQEFRDFIQNIKPSDFEKLLKDDNESNQ